MEAEMACPKCNAPLIPKGDKLVCTRETCGYRREIVKHIPNQAELLKENEALRAFVEAFLKRTQTVYKEENSCPYPSLVKKAEDLLHK